MKKNKKIPDKSSLVIRTILNTKINEVKNKILDTTQWAHDVPGTSTEGPLKVVTLGTYRGSSGDQCKN